MLYLNFLCSNFDSFSPISIPLHIYILLPLPLLPARCLLIQLISVFIMLATDSCNYIIFYTFFNFFSKNILLFESSLTWDKITPILRKYTVMLISYFVLHSKDNARRRIAKEYNFFYYPYTVCIFIIIGGNLLFN